MIAAIQLLEYLHTLDRCNPLQCKHMIQVFLLMLENKLIYPPKVKLNKTNLLSATRIPACTIKVSLTEQCLKTTFHRWKKLSRFSLTHSCTPWFNQRATSLTVNIEIKRQTIADDCLWHHYYYSFFFFFLNWIFKKNRDDNCVCVCVVHLTAIQFWISKKHIVCAQMYSSYSCPCLANEWITPAFTFVQWNSICWYSIFWTPAKKHLRQTTWR